MVKTGAGISTTWDRTTAFLGDHLGRIVPIALFVLFVPSTLSGSIQLATLAGMDAITRSVLVFVLTLLTIYGQLVLTAYALDPASSEGAYRLGARRLLPALGIYLLLGVAVMLLVLPIFLIVSAYGGDLSAMSGGTMVAVPEGAEGPILLYSLIFVAVALWLLSRLCLTTAVIVAERRGIGALPRSFALTRGVTLRLVGVILLYLVVVFVATLAAGNVFGAIFVLATGGNVLGEVLTVIAVSLVTTILTVVQTIFLALLYRGRAELPVTGSASDDGPWTRTTDR